MRRPLAWLLLLLVPALARAQAGFSADLFDPDLSGEGLVVVRGPNLVTGRLQVALESDFGYHLLGIDASTGNGTQWIVQERLSLRFGLSYTPFPFLRIEAGFTTVPEQAGSVTDLHGAPASLESGMGDSWVSLVWGVPWLFGSSWDAALGATLVLPTAPPDTLAGDSGLDFKVEALAGTRIWVFRPLINLGIAARPKTSFRNLVRSDGLIYRLGVEVGESGWPVRFSLELSGESLLASPFSSAPNEALEALAGLKVALCAGFEFQAAGGVGIVGAATPSGRGILTVRWSWREEKRGSASE